MNNWTEFTNSDEQIADMFNSRFIVDCQGKQHDYIFSNNDFDTTDELKAYCSEVALQKYWLIPDDPLREIKVRQAMTGQPVWIRSKDNMITVRTVNAGDVLTVYSDNISMIRTTTPDWNIPNAEYSFTEFKD